MRTRMHFVSVAGKCEASPDCLRDYGALNAWLAQGIVGILAFRGIKRKELREIIAGKTPCINYSCTSLAEIITIIYIYKVYIIKYY